MNKIRMVGEPVPLQRTEGSTVKLSTFIPLKIRKRGARKVIVHPRDITVGPSTPRAAHHDSPLQVALARAFYWQHLLDESVVASGADIAKREGLHHSTVNELLRLTLLDPIIVQRILAGQQPRCMSLLWFQRNPLPLDWMEQRSLIEAFDR